MPIAGWPVTVVSPSIYREEKQELREVKAGVQSDPGWSAITRTPRIPAPKLTRQRAAFFLTRRGGGSGSGRPGTASPGRQVTCARNPSRQRRRARGERTALRGAPRPALPFLLPGHFLVRSRAGTLVTLHRRVTSPAPGAAPGRLPRVCAPPRPLGPATSSARARSTWQQRPTGGAAAPGRRASPRRPHHGPLAGAGVPQALVDG